MGMPLMGNAVMAYQGFPHMGCRQNASQGMFFFQISGRADTWKHRCIHITQKKSHIPLLHGKPCRQFYRHCGLSGTGASPDCQHLVFILRLPVRRVVTVSPAENTVFQKIQGLFHPTFLGFFQSGLICFFF